MGNLHDSKYLDYGKLLQSLHGGYEFMMKTGAVSVSKNRVDFISARSAAYDEHGNLIAVQNQDGSGYTLLNEYSGDQLSKQERYSDEGSMISRVSFEYDDDGLLKRATFLTPGATTTVTVLYKNGPVYAPDAEE